MIETKKLLIIVLDGEHARLVRAGEGNVLHTARRISATAVHKRSSELRSDRPGASYHSDSTARHAITPRHDPHDLEKAKFARFVADEINRMGEDEFDGLVLAAPAYALNVVMDELRPIAYAKLLGTVAKDLVKTPDDELWEHMKKFLPPATSPRVG